MPNPLATLRRALRDEPFMVPALGLVFALALFA